MPIKGLSDQVRLPRLGKIRLGIKVEGQGSPYPQPVDYFVCPGSVAAVYGRKPRELRIVFPTEDPSSWASQFYRCYSRSRGLVCKGDGERASVLIDEDSGTPASGDSRRTALRDIECDAQRCPEYGSRCRRVMNLQFLLPDVPGLGVWQIDSSSYWSISNINSGVRLLCAICGRISMIPLTLKLTPQQVYANGSRKTAHVLSLDIPGTMGEALRYARMLPGDALLPSPDAEPPQDLFPAAVLSSEEADAPTQQETTPAAPAIANLGELFSACYKRHGLCSFDVIKLLGYASKDEIGDPEDAWRRVSAVMTAGQEAAAE